MTIPSVRSISLGVWIDVGSRNESASESGVSHLIEHLVFKGTRRRNARQIASDLESIGGSLNAFTSREQTCFLARILDEHLETAVDVLSDITCHATMTSTNIKREKMVIVEEIKESVDNPSDLIYDLFSATCWNTHPLGRPIMGTQKSVLNIPRSDIMGYLKRNYCSSSIVIVAAGSVFHRKLVRLVRKYFDFASGSAPAAIEAIPATKRNIKVQQNDNQQTHLCLGFPAPGFNSKLRITAALMSTYLGGGMSSVLFQKIREERGLVYSVYCYNDSYRETGIFATYLGTDKSNLAEAVGIVLAESRKLKQRVLPTTKLHQIKAQLKGHLTMGLESTSSQMTRIGRQELLLGRHISLKESLKEIDRVSAKSIRELANEVFDENRMAAAVLGPSDGNMFDHVR